MIAKVSLDGRVVGTADFVLSANRQVIHKIGVTGGDVQARIAAAPLDPTYLLAGVEVVATYKLVNINRGKLEKLLHRFFAPARIDLEITDRFGNPVKPREWFLVPRAVIDEVVERIRDRTIDRYEYDPATASMVARRGALRTLTKSAAQSDG